MNFYINKKNLTINGGPYNFANILEKELVKIGLKKKYLFPDIQLTFSTGSLNKFSTNILRVDGIYVQNLNNDKIKLNHKIFKNILLADGVVFQSKFSKDLIFHYMKKDKFFDYKKINYKIIGNAFTNQFFLKNKIKDYNYKYVLMTITRPSLNKRLKYILDAFSNLDQNEYLLLIIGETLRNLKKKYKNIKFIGNVKNSKIPFYIQRSDALIHVSKIESCPNAIVEALSSGLPVLTNNVGGSKELIKKNGIILNIDENLTYHENYFSEYPFNIDILVRGIKKIVNIKRSKTNSFTPNRIAKKYIDFFNEIRNAKHKT